MSKSVHNEIPTDRPAGLFWPHPLNSIRLARALEDSLDGEMELLLFFKCQCRGVKFYDLRSAGARYGTRLSLVREPTNLQDPLNCVAAWVPGPWSSGHRAILGHVAKETARWLNPLLDSCFHVTK